MRIDSPLDSSKYDFSTTPKGSVEYKVPQNIFSCEIISITNTSLCLNIEKCDKKSLDEEINLLEVFNTDPFIQENSEFLYSLLKTEYSQLLPNDELTPEKTNEKNLDNPKKLITRNILRDRQKIEDPENPGKFIPRSTVHGRQKIEDPENPGEFIPRSTVRGRQKIEDPENPGEFITRAKLYSRQKIEDPENPGKLITKYALRKRKKIEDPENPGKLITINTLYHRNHLKKIKMDTSQPLSLSVATAQKCAILHNSERD